jgi:AraC-like DNA-binding protein
MKVARTVLLQNKEIMIKDLAAQMGYSSAAKFAAAFREEIGVLPSEIMESECQM